VEATGIEEEEEEDDDCELLQLIVIKSDCKRRHY
jgi:hypothetical protein